VNRKIVNAIALGIFSLVIALSPLCPARAQDSGPSYERMVPIDRYLMADRNAEIALARNAAPESISRDAEVLLLGRHGYETAVKGTNGFVCVVERSWMSPFDDPEFLNPDQRLPLCLNAPAARTHLPLTFKMTDLALAGSSKTQMFDGIRAAFDKKELPVPEPGSRCYMMSKTTVLCPQVWERRSSFNVLVSQNRRYALGRGSPWLPGVRTSILS
jgi:hypothetical protein